MAHKLRVPTKVPLRHRWNVSLSGAAKIRGAYATTFKRLGRRATSSFSCCVCHAVEVLRFKTAITPSGSVFHRQAWPSHAQYNSLRRASAMASVRMLGVTSPKGAGCAQQVLAFQCTRRVGKSLAAGYKVLANHSLNRTLHGMPSFGPPFHSGPNPAMPFHAG